MSWIISHAISAVKSETPQRQCFPVRPIETATEHKSLIIGSPRRGYTAQRCGDVVVNALRVRVS